MVSIDPKAGPAYQAPARPVDAIEPPEFSGDTGFSGPQNPDGSDIGPLYLSPEAEQWVNDNVVDQGYMIDWGTREIFDPETGEVKGTVPTSIPRMI